ncbi:MAG: hypothetical protein E7J90_11520 [Cutibacterium avidum]|nr:hypothetical protein [Cutibacterium avidum]
MLQDKSGHFTIDGAVTITSDQAEAATQLLRDHDAADLIEMLINPEQISDSPPPAAPQPRRFRTIGTTGRRIA